MLQHFFFFLILATSERNIGWDFFFFWLFFGLCSVFPFPVPSFFFFFFWLKLIDVIFFSHRDIGHQSARISWSRCGSDFSHTLLPTGVSSLSLLNFTSPLHSDLFFPRF